MMTTNERIEKAAEFLLGVLGVSGATIIGLSLVDLGAVLANDTGLHGTGLFDWLFWSSVSVLAASAALMVGLALLKGDS